MAKTILIVDDDSHIREVLRFALQKAGFHAEEASNGKQALEMVHHHSYECIILDIAMPEMDGLEVCKILRKTSEVPILFLSSRDEEIDRIIGLEIGGDDYVTKPFSPRELVARIHAILKRTAPRTPTAHNPLQKGALRVNTDSYCAFWHNIAIPLTATEFMLLATLLRYPEKVYSRDALMDSAYANIIVSDRTIDSHIRRIRQKCAEYGALNVIETMHGIGYKMGSCQ